MLTPQIQDLIDLYISESRDQGYSSRDVNQSSWVRAQLALENYENGLGYGPDDTILIEDWNQFKGALQ